MAIGGMLSLLFFCLPRSRSSAWSALKAHGLLILWLARSQTCISFKCKWIPMLSQSRMISLVFVFFPSKMTYNLGRREYFDHRYKSSMTELGSKSSRYSSISKWDFIMYQNLHKCKRYPKNHAQNKCGMFKIDRTLFKDIKDTMAQYFCCHKIIITNNKMHDSSYHLIR